jgi:hypothetical protein
VARDLAGERADANATEQRALANIIEQAIGSGDHARLPPDMAAAIHEATAGFH